MSETKKYICDICNKIYYKYSSMWSHNNKYHNDTKEECKLKCKYCNNVYKHMSSKSRHEENCKTNDRYDFIKENKELKKMIIGLKTIINNNTTNNNTINNNTTNNNTLNINNVYVKYDNFSYDKVLTQQEIIEILQKRFMAIEESIKKVHFNSNKEEYNNIHITNLEGKVAFVYDGGDKMIAVDKDSFLNDLIGNHICEIDKHKKLVKDKKTVNILDTLVTDINDEKKEFNNGDKTHKNYMEFKKEGINRIIYNNTDKKKFNKINKLKLIEKI